MGGHVGRLEGLRLRRPLESSRAPSSIGFRFMHRVTRASYRCRGSAVAQKRPYGSLVAAIPPQIFPPPLNLGP